jgi:hypothetical protein
VFRRQRFTVQTVAEESTRCFLSVECDDRVSCCDGDAIERAAVPGEPEQSLE